MTQHFGVSDIRFYLTDPQPCPYLPGRLERKMFTPLRGEAAPQLSDALSRNGFRRSQSVAYRPRCVGCTACISVRTPVMAFELSRSFRRIVKRNDILNRRVTGPMATAEQYALFRRYLDSRHADGAMIEMGEFDFAVMVEDSPAPTRVVEYRDPDGTLIAAALTDVMSDGFSMVYSFFDPDRASDSLGAFIILDHIEAARRAGLPYVYLGYWIRNARKMAYKARFQPLEGLIGGVWRRLSPQQLAPDGALLDPDAPSAGKR